MNIVALSGKKGSGKSSLAKLLLENEETLFPNIHYSGSVAIFSFAKGLKQFCIDYLGLTEEQCYTAEGKESETKQLRSVYKDFSGFFVQYNRSTYMTAREVMQWWGEYLRQFDPDIWINKLVKDIDRVKPDLVIIDDLRYLNEAKIIKKLGGKLIRLTRCSGRRDPHRSETELDDYQGFDCILDNNTVSLMESYKDLVQLIRGWGFIC